jgi:hypothetical protein
MWGCGERAGVEEERGAVARRAAPLPFLSQAAERATQTRKHEEEEASRRRRAFLES